MKNALFAKDQEDVSPGSQTKLEYLVVSEILSYCNRTNMETDVGTTTIIYSAVLQLANAMDVLIPLGPKDEQGIRKVICAYERNRVLFEALCITQLKMRNP